MEQIELNKSNKKLEDLLRHIENVKENCLLLSKKLLEEGEKEFALQLIANSYIHDNSKFSGIEWLYLEQEIKDKSPDLFKMAVIQHTTTNPHHPEYWKNINEMPRIYIAEMVCDWKARSSEFGNDILMWIKDKATEKYNFNTSGKVYKEIKHFLDLILDKKF